MAKFLCHATYTVQGLQGLIKEGATSRRDAVEKLVNSLGGTLETYYYAFGERYCQMLWISFHGVCPWISHPQRIGYAAFRISCSPLGKLTPA